jgi:hypothetical protein
MHRFCIANLDSAWPAQCSELRIFGHECTVCYYNVCVLCYDDLGPKPGMATVAPTSHKLRTSPANEPFMQRGQSFCVLQLENDPQGVQIQDILYEMTSWPSC